MSVTTIQRGNILHGNFVQVAIGANAIGANTTAEVSFTIPGANTIEAVFASFAGQQTAGIVIANAYVSASNTVKVVFANVTGSSANTAAGNMNFYIVRSEQNPVPSSTI